MNMITRIASRYLFGDGPHPRWDDFLKAKYEGGKKKVPNTNPKTKNRYPQVTMQTLFKSDEGFKKRVMKEYSAWMKTQSESDNGPLSTSETEKKVPSPKKSVRQIPSDVLGSHEDVDAFLEKHSAAINAAMKQYTEKKAYYEQRLSENPDSNYYSVLPTYEIRSESEKESFTTEVQLLARTSDAVGSAFEEKFSSIFRVAKELFDSWRDSNLSEFSIAMQNWVAGKPTTLGTAQKNNLRKQYLFTQAFFKKAGITHVTVFRGVKGQGLDTDPPSEGDAVEVGAHSLSCWTMNLNVARRFGDRCCIATVPVEQVFASPLTDPQFGHSSDFAETEFILMPEKGKDYIPVTVGGFN